MSLLEDVFLENEAGEAQELERVIEGDEFDERPRSATPDSDENSAKEDEAEEDKRGVDPTQAKPKRIIKNPRFILNPARLSGPRGIQILPEHFKDFTFKGKGHEKEDLDLVLKKLEHWAYRLYPKFGFEDCLKKIETLGKKRPVMVHLHKIRTDQFLSEETVNQKDSSDEGENPPASPQMDEFDVLLQQQIDLARATPGPHENGHSAKKGLETPLVEKIIMPNATSSPSMNDEQRERMLRNRRLAEERRLARLKQNSHENNTSNSNDNINDDRSDKMNDNNTTNESHYNRDEYNTNDVSNNRNDISKNDSLNIKTNSIIKKHNKSNVIDSSDEETDSNIAGQSVAVDIHDTNREISQKIDKRMNDNDNIKNKRSKSNIIDSSDEETDSNAAGQSVTVDIHDTNREISQKINKHMNDYDNMKYKRSKSNIINSSDEETDSNIAGQSVTVDIHDTNGEISQKNDENINNNDNIQKKNNKSNVIDSLDDETDKHIVSQSATVDIHGNYEISQKNDEISNYNIIKTQKNDAQIIVNSESHKYDSDVSLKNDTDVLQNKYPNSNNYDVTTTKNDIEMIVDNESQNNDRSNIDTSTSQQHINTKNTKFNTSTTEVNQSLNSDKLLENDVAEDIMDVDFSDDFQMISSV